MSLLFRQVTLADIAIKYRLFEQQFAGAYSAVSFGPVQSDQSTELTPNNCTNVGL